MFTGERVIPGEVEPDLWNQHLSRYHFAATFAAAKKVLDAGCGTGYGTALLAGQASEALGFDISPEAIAYAREHYPLPRFEIAPANAFPAPRESAGLITAFEVIEHLPDWQDLIQEAYRVLAPGGIFLVSTPNKLYYSESRQETGPNPFHVHEFELDAFREALETVFPFVRILAQNQQECIVFAGEQIAGSGLSLIAASPELAEAQFLLAVCAKQAVEIPPFTYLPSSGNLLRDREHYIRSLNSELSQSHAGHATLLEAHHRLQEELDRHNAWALSLDRELAQTRNEAQAAIGRLARERELIKRSRWIRLGRKFRLGPDLA